MLAKDQELVQLLNTAIITSKENKISASYEERLSQICQSKAIEAYGMAIKYLAESLEISRDNAAVMLVDTVRDLDRVWDDFIKMEGLSKLKESLRNPIQ